MIKASLLEYALMADDVYGDDNEPLLPTLTAFGWARFEAETQFFHFGLFARIYYNPVFKAYVFAFRGTELENVSDIIADTEYVFELDFPMLKAARQFFSYHQQKLGLSPENLMLTGHSLGGILAKMLGLEYCYRAVAFNAPGVAKLTHHADHQQYIVNVNAIHGLIHEFGKALGECVDVPVVEGALPAVVRHHAMQTMVDSLRFNDDLGARRV